MKSKKTNFDYMLKYNKLVEKVEKKGYKIEFKENFGEIYVYNKDNEVIGYFYDEPNKELNASDYKLACKNLKSILKNQE